MGNPKMGEYHPLTSRSVVYANNTTSEAHSRIRMNELWQESTRIDIYGRYLVAGDIFIYSRVRNTHISRLQTRFSLLHRSSILPAAAECTESEPGCCPRRV